MYTLKTFGAVANNIGNFRTNNEDNFFLNGRFMEKALMDSGAAIQAKSRSLLQVYAVFDGMGGEASGEDASSTAAKLLSEHLPGFRSFSGAEQAIDHFVSTANDQIAAIGSTLCGTTMALLCLHGNTATICWMGDSRIYLFRNNQLTQLTVDHTEAQRLNNIGILSKEDISTHPMRNSLTRYLGMREREFTIRGQFTGSDLSLLPNDLFLLCSDGITDFLDDSVISKECAKREKPLSICNSLVKRALDAGGKDNVTAMCIQLQGVPKHSQPIFLATRQTVSDKGTPLPADAECLSYEDTIDLDKPSL